MKLTVTIKLDIDFEFDEEGDDWVMQVREEINHSSEALRDDEYELVQISDDSEVLWGMRKAP